MCTVCRWRSYPPPEHIPSGPSHNSYRKVSPANKVKMMCIIYYNSNKIYIKYFSLIYAGCFTSPLYIAYDQIDLPVIRVWSQGFGCFHSLHFKFFVLSVFYLSLEAWFNYHRQKPESPKLSLFAPMIIIKKILLLFLSYAYKDLFLSKSSHSYKQQYKLKNILKGTLQSLCFKLKRRNIKVTKVHERLPRKSQLQSWTKIVEIATW